MGVMYSLPSYKFNELQTRMKGSIILINTMNTSKQDCLIKNTLKANVETEQINKLLKNNKNQEIVVYGVHHTDISVINKYNQLKKLGFKNVYIYYGGMYEWLLLQEVFGNNNFQTDGMIKDIVEYKID
uniref:Rhodanese domain-containing protein n=1 Tax=viral metagenome TaxID=1070528 RepID=A0A6C0ET26_9ZZZZ